MQNSGTQFTAMRATAPGRASRCCAMSVVIAGALAAAAGPAAAQAAVLTLEAAGVAVEPLEGFNVGGLARVVAQDKSILGDARR